MEQAGETIFSEVCIALTFWQLLCQDKSCIKKSLQLTLINQYFVDKQKKILLGANN